MFVLRLLGGAHIEGDAGVAGRQAGQPRRVALLALLAAAPNETVSRDKLVAYLWPERDEEKGRHALSESLYVLRKALGEEALLSKGGNVRLSTEIVWSDLIEFEAAVECGDLERAVSLYEVPFLDGFYLRDTPEFERWIDGERDRLSHTYKKTLEDLAEAADERGDAQASAEWWRRLAAEDPYSSRIAMRLMQALNACGDRATALQHARAHIDRVREELGGEPDPEVSALAEWLAEPGAREPQPGAGAIAAEADAEEAFVRTGALAPAERGLLPPAFVTVLVAASIAGLWLASEGIRPDVPADETPRLIVLPLVNLGTPEEQNIADGITEELTARLAGIQGLEVLSRTTAYAYRETEQTAQQIGEELEVDFILEGAVRFESMEEGERRIRITPQLIRTSDGIHMWTEPVELELVAGIFQVQIDIAERVARALDITLLEPERRLFRRQPTDNLQAYDYYVRGKAHELRGEERAAVSMYEMALELDPDFAEGHAALARAIRRLGFFGARDVLGERARLALDKAAELGPDLVETRLALGETYYRSRRYDSATVHLEFVRARQPSNSEAIALIGWMQRRQGKWEESVANIETAVALDPRNHLWAGNLGHSLLLMRRYSEAERYLERAIAMAPDNATYHKWLAVVYMSWDGGLARARGSLEEAVSRSGGTVLLNDLQLNRIYADESGLDLGQFEPADGAADDSYFLAKAAWYGRRNQTELARACYDSARALSAADYVFMMDREYREGWNRGCRTRTPGHALAGLGRTEEALAYAKKHAQICTPSGDAVSGPLRAMDLAEIYVTAGMYDAAIEQLEYTLSIPSPINAGVLKVDPLYDPLRDHPRFRALLEKYD